MTCRYGRKTDETPYDELDYEDKRELEVRFLERINATDLLDFFDPTPQDLDYLKTVLENLSHTVGTPEGDHLNSKSPTKDAQASVGRVFYHIFRDTVTPLIEQQYNERDLFL